MTQTDRLRSLKTMQGQLHEAMEQLKNKDYSETERLLHIVDRLMLELIRDEGGQVV
jgi:hypothetical protein